MTFYVCVFEEKNYIILYVHKDNHIGMVGQKLDYEIVGAYLPYIIFSFFSVATIQRIRKSVVPYGTFPTFLGAS